ncbi:TasA family protein [Bacillus spongiae]|uniref:TasA family protein n=1 Tax=Bacillus spongiae TaxID=2683610 RepID=A0ABU8HEJ0_9BACI
MKGRYSFFILISVVFLCLFSNGSVKAFPNQQIKEIDIASSPTNILFNITNMKPGDWATRTITIHNNGKQDFNYSMSTKRNAGSKELYNELQIVISDEKKELYSGNLSHFEGFPLRNLLKSADEEITFKIDFPSYLGNEFQGLEVEVEFLFYVDEPSESLLPLDISMLPDTATNTMSILLLGMVLLSGGLVLYLYQNKGKLNI